jgi:hypothetical protein
MKQKYIGFLMVIAISMYGALAHAEYKSGITGWPVKNGRLILVSGILFDNSHLYYHNYSFYLIGRSDNTEGKSDSFFMIPIVKNKTDPDACKGYDLNFSTFNIGEDTITDALVVTRAGNAWFVTAHKKGYEASPRTVTTKIYRLFEGGEAEWAYYFAPISGGKTYPESYTVEQALSEAAKNLH